MLHHLLLHMKTTVGYSGQQGTHRDDFVLLPPVKSCFLICQPRQGLFSEASKIAKAFDKSFLFLIQVEAQFQRMSLE